jgi:hypothetical protein
MPGSFATTARFALRMLLGNSKVSDIDEGFAALAEDVASKMMGFSADTLAKRPAAGITNRLFRATDTGAYYFDSGSEWVALLSYAQGTELGRPTAGRAGRLYRATDTGTAALDTGTIWVPILTDGSSWQGRIPRALATAYQPSTARPVQVHIDLQLAPSPGFGKEATIYVNGAVYSELFVGGQSVESGDRLGDTFIVPTGQTWQVNDTTGTGGISGLFSNYLLL